MGKIVKTKYHGNIDLDMYKEYTVKNIFKALPLKEEGKDWKKYLEGLLIELNGMDILVSEVNLMAVIGKLEGLKDIEEHDMFRKVIFDCIDLIKKI